MHHADGHTLSYASWETRGWCRMERMVRELLGKLMVRKCIGGVRLKMIVKSKSVCVDICIYVYLCVSICESKHTPLDAAVGFPFGIYLLYGNDDLAHLITEAG